jgi:hypothetical protein
MDRKEKLRRLLNQAQFNGFQFREWYQTQVHSAWPGTEQALTLLATEGRYYTLLFSHEFVRSFWQAGSRISFSVPETTYSRVNGRGETIKVTRKPFTRRSNKPDVWKYHVRQMAAAENPLEYLCRFLPKPDQDMLRASAPPARIAVEA